MKISNLQAHQNRSVNGVDGQSKSADGAAGNANLEIRANGPCLTRLQIKDVEARGTR